MNQTEMIELLKKKMPDFEWYDYYDNDIYGLVKTKYRGRELTLRLDYKPAKIILTASERNGNEKRESAIERSFFSSWVVNEILRFFEDEKEHVNMLKIMSDLKDE